MLPVREANRFCKSVLLLTLKNKSLHLRCSDLCRHYSSKPTHYEVLGLTREASSEDIRAAYIKKSKECHPDINSKDPANHGQFISVNEAYTVLSKPLSRLSYDAVLQQEQTQKQSPSSHFNQPRYHYPDVEIERAKNIRKQNRMQGTHRNKGGSKRDSNMKTVGACVLVLVAGSFMHLLAYMWSTEIHMKNLDARDARARKQLLMAKENLGRFHVQENGLPRDS